MDTRLKIIEAATNLFFEKGFYQVTLTEIAKRAKISQPGIYNHFDGMDDIMISACTHWLEEGKKWIDQQVDPRQTAREQIKAILAANLTYTFQNRKRDALILGLTYYAIHSMPAKATYVMITASGTERFVLLAIRGNQDGSWRVDDPESCGRMIYNLLLIELINTIVAGESESLKARIKRFTRDVLMLLPE